MKIKVCFLVLALCVLSGVTINGMNRRTVHSLIDFYSKYSFNDFFVKWIDDQMKGYFGKVADGCADLAPLTKKKKKNIVSEKRAADAEFNQKHGIKCFFADSYDEQLNLVEYEKKQMRMFLDPDFCKINEEGINEEEKKCSKENQIATKVEALCCVKSFLQQDLKKVERKTPEFYAVSEQRIKYYNTVVKSLPLRCPKVLLIEIE